MALLDVSNLSVSFHTRNGVVEAVKDISFSVDSGQILGIVGESGSGKSVTCYSLMSLIPMPPGRIESGSAMFDGTDLLNVTGEQLRQIRGTEIAMIFQDPMTCLNPYLTVGEQLIEPLIYHHKTSRADAKTRAIALLDEVGIKQPEQRYNSYPHEFSGGMRQRVMIAMALINEPRLLICDEPTTALDVTIQQQILELIKNLQQKHDMAVIFITHDLGVVAELADNVLVMCKGEQVESGAAEQIFKNPSQTYTQKLLAAIPSGAKPSPSRAQSAPEPWLAVNHLKTYFKDRSGAKGSVVKAVDDVSLQIAQGEIVGLVGESGSGKSTLGRAILQLAPVTQGEIQFQGAALQHLNPTQMLRYRRKMQMIFQDPYASLNPRMTVFETLAEPLLYHGIATKKSVQLQVAALMDDVGLARKYVRKYPHEFSGGQRQRIAIGRAIATKPEFIVADEPVSALDVTIQAQILDLILGLVEKHNLTMLFISHDLAVVRYIADRVLVMYHGKILEQGDTEPLWHNPQHDYTRKLLQAVPIIT